MGGCQGAREGCRSGMMLGDRAEWYKSVLVPFVVIVLVSNPFQGLKLD